MREYDLVVIGGGPGGSTAASFVAKRGHRVLLLERETFPRYQIGESLLPSTVHGICKMLGVSEEIERANFVRKRGGTFRWGLNAEPWTFDFAHANVTQRLDWHYALQVERAKFDEILLRNVTKCGGEVQERAAVQEIWYENDRARGVRWTDQDGQRHEASTRFIIDASGHRSLFHKDVGERVFSDLFKNVALFCYFENGKRLPSPNEGNILCVAFDDGWFWYIPLTRTSELTSVGVVTRRENADRLRDPEKAMAYFRAKCPLISEYLANAKRITTGMYGEYRTRTDYSYCNTRFWRAGLTLVGDAAAFIDPVFSSGVHLSTYSALLAARSVNACLAGTLDEQTAFDEFETRYRREFKVFYDFLLAFYDMRQATDGYFWHARSVLKTEESKNEAFIRLVAGAGTTSEDFFRARQGVGDVFQALTENAAAKLEAMPGATDHSERIAKASHVAQSLVFLAQAGLSDVEQEVAAEDKRATPVGISEDGLAWCRA